LPEVTLTAEELKEKLCNKIAQLLRAAEAFDDGYEVEAETLAVHLRVLLHDTTKSTSLLKAIFVATRNLAYDKWKMQFHDTAGDQVPGNLVPHNFFLMMGMDKGSGGYIAPLDDTPFGGKTLPFATWWDRVVFIDGVYKHQFSRSKLVRSVANQDGGAHVGETMDEAYYKFTRENTMQHLFGIDRSGITIAMSAPQNQPAYPAIRQIAHETLKTLHDVFPECFAAPYATVSMKERGISADIFVTGASLVANPTALQKK
jgi:hypothetical protein